MYSRTDQKSFRWGSDCRRSPTACQSPTVSFRLAACQYPAAWQNPAACQSLDDRSHRVRDLTPGLMDNSGMNDCSHYLTGTGSRVGELSQNFPLMDIVLLSELPVQGQSMTGYIFVLSDDNV